jgi:hypothetical protein
MESADVKKFEVDATMTSAAVKTARRRERNRREAQCGRSAHRRL